MDGNGALVPVSMKGRESSAVVVDELGALSFLHRRFGCDRRQESLHAGVLQLLCQHQRLRITTSLTMILTGLLSC
jgi:hypothetical protein